jgi:hypothetical protein
MEMIPFNAQAEGDDAELQPNESYNKAKARDTELGRTIEALRNEIDAIIAEQVDRYCSLSWRAARGHRTVAIARANGGRFRCTSTTICKKTSIEGRIAPLRMEP